MFADIPGFDEAMDGSVATAATGLTEVGQQGTAVRGKRCDSNSNFIRRTSTASNHQEDGGTMNVTERKKNGTVENSGGAAAGRGTIDGELRNGRVKRDTRKDDVAHGAGVKDKAIVSLVNGGSKPPNAVKAECSNGEAEQPAGRDDLELHDGIEGADDGNGAGGGGGGVGSNDNDPSLLFEYEEADRPLPPLYVLKDENHERWMLMNDLCTFLKFKSKEAVLKQVSFRLGVSPRSVPFTNHAFRIDSFADMSQQHSEQSARADTRNENRRVPGPLALSAAAVCGREAQHSLVEGGASEVQRQRAQSATGAELRDAHLAV